MGLGLSPEVTCVLWVEEWVRVPRWDLCRRQQLWFCLGPRGECCCAPWRCTVLSSGMRSSLIASACHSWDDPCTETRSHPGASPSYPPSRYTLPLHTLVTWGLCTQVRVPGQGPRPCGLRALPWSPGTSPHAPGSVRVQVSMTTANVSWEPGYDGGYEQTFSVWYGPL